MGNFAIPSDLLQPLLDGMFEDALWQTFLDRLRALTGASYVSLIFRQPAPSASTLVHLYAGHASPPLVERLYRESLHKRDPLPYRRLTEGRLYATQDLLKQGNPAHDAYRRDVLEPSGMNVIRLMRVMEVTGVNVWLTLGRPTGDFSGEHDALVQALAPYIRTALRCFVALERERFNASVAAEAIRRLNFGWFTLDATGAILDSDAQGAMLLDRSDILQRGPGRRLMARTADVDREILGAIKAIATDPRGRPRALILNQDPWLDMLFVPINRRSISPGPAPALIAYVHGDSWSSADRCDQIAELFALLPSEARLALALSRGMTIAEAACDLGLTIETARTYSKKIYAKTGARGQPDLVRFIHRSVLAIA